jgi:hypothetical protein
MISHAKANNNKHLRIDCTSTLFSAPTSHFLPGHFPFDGQKLHKNNSYAPSYFNRLQISWCFHRSDGSRRAVSKNIVTRSYLSTRSIIYFDFCYRLCRNFRVRKYQIFHVQFRNAQRRSKKRGRQKAFAVYLRNRCQWIGELIGGHLNREIKSMHLMEKLTWHYVYTELKLFREKPFEQLTSGNYVHVIEGFQEIAYL